MKNFTLYIKESAENDLKLQLKQMIENSLKSSDKKTVQDFISAYKQNSEENKIEGLINTSDVYDFYLKYKEDIDSILNDNDFYSKSPEELKVFGLYDYIIAGTKEAITFLLANFNETQGQKEEEENIDIPRF